jgi:4-carboxymuconolactone decarboxylase
MARADEFMMSPAGHGLGVAGLSDPTSTRNTTCRWSSHRNVSPAERQRQGITDGLVRLSVGIEDLEEIKAALLHATAYCGIPAGLDAFRAAHEVLVSEGALGNPKT